MSLVPLALLMGAVTYPFRAFALLVPGVERWPRHLLDYLRLMGPAVLAALAAAAALLVIDVAGHASLRLGIEGLAVLACAGIVAWRRNLFLGLA
ncbi:MAG TPA: AzlD domain-containing protein, partial [Candidatus Limnocylindrales bacterium]|nr:AzlD domain-containing protein [Candidatus Limnocylindrales bacterium]